MKLGFADAYAYVRDPRTMRVAPAALLDRGYLAARANGSTPRARRISGRASRPKAGRSIFARRMRTA